MPEWWVADIMAQRNSFDQVFIEVEKAGNGPGNAGDQLNVKNAMGYVIVGNQAEYLGFVDVA